MRYVTLGVCTVLLASGCGAARQSSLLLERTARGPLEEAPTVGREISWKVTPLMQTKSQAGIDVTVNYASQEYLNNFFNNRRVFGKMAGQNPYYPENFVFYVNIANQSGKTIRIDPIEFCLVDDKGNQLSTIGVDYVTALADYRQPVSTATRGVLEEARPGYFGLSLPIGKFFAQKPQWRFALIKQSSLQTGYLYTGVVYDGLIAFRNPSTDAEKLRVIMPGFKMNFDANDVPKDSFDFVFDFGVTK